MLPSTSDGRAILRLSASNWTIATTDLPIIITGLIGDLCKKKKITKLSLSLLCEEFLELRVQVFPRSKDVFPYWNSIGVGDSAADFCQGNQLSIQPDKIRLIDIFHNTIP